MEETSSSRSKAPATGAVAARATPAPDILDYMDYRLYLKERLEHLQSVDRKYSGRWVARRAGFKSPQLLSMIIQGHRNLTKEKAADLARVLKLTQRETEYFLMIVELAACEGHDAQRELLGRIETSFRDGLFAAIPDDGIEIFRDWYYPAIREIVTLTDAPASGDAAVIHAWIAERLGIPVEAAVEALATLVDKGFLRAGASGRLERATPSIRTARNKMYPMLLGAWHLKMLERAFSSIRLPRDRRCYEGLTFAVPRRQIPQLKEMVQRFFREVDSLVESQAVDREEVCHLHVALFPLTKWVEPQLADQEGVGAVGGAAAATPARSAARAATAAATPARSAARAATAKPAAANPAAAKPAAANPAAAKPAAAKPARKG